MTRPGLSRRRRETVVSPICDSWPHVPALASASSAELDTGEQALQARGHVQLHALHVLLSVGAADRRRQRAERAGVDVRRPARERRAERQRRAGAGLPLGPDVMWKLLDAVAGASPGSADHGVNNASVV